MMNKYNHLEAGGTDFSTPMPADTPPLTPEELDAIASRRALACRVFITSPNADLVFNSLRDVPRLITDLKQARAEIKHWKEAFDDRGGYIDD